MICYVTQPVVEGRCWRFVDRGPSIVIAKSIFISFTDCFSSRNARIASCRSGECVTQRPARRTTVPELLYLLLSFDRTVAQVPASMWWSPTAFGSLSPALTRLSRVRTHESNGNRDYRERPRKKGVPARDPDQADRQANQSTSTQYGGNAASCPSHPPLHVLSLMHVLRFRLWGNFCFPQGPYFFADSTLGHDRRAYHPTRTTRKSRSMRTRIVRIDRRCPR